MIIEARQEPIGLNAGDCEPGLSANFILSDSIRRMASRSPHRIDKDVLKSVFRVMIGRARGILAGSGSRFVPAFFP